MSFGIRTEVKNSFLRKVYFQMFFGVIITSFVSFYTFANENLLEFVYRFYTPIIIAELLLVLTLNIFIFKISDIMAKLMFILYSAMNGLLLSSIFLRFNIISITTIFVVTAVIFLVMSVYGIFTKENLESYSSFFRGGLIALVLVSIINLFFKVGIVDWVMSVFAVALFTGLIAYDTQRIVGILEENRFDEKEVSKFSTIGALMLYLDFVNLFLHLMKLFGKKR